MTESTEQPNAPGAPRPGQDPASRQHVLFDYLWSNRRRYTETALAKASAEAGFTPDEIAAAAADVARLRRDEIAARPVKARARRIVLAMYGITFLVFAVLFLRPTAPENTFLRGSGPIALGILAVVMFVAILGGLAFIAAQRPPAEQAEGALGLMLALPFALLVIVAGSCLATTGPLITAPGA